jgi:5-methylcytosine-specific restriction endonuclease McrA
MSKRKSISKNLRYAILERDKFTCQYCGGTSPDVKLTIDHLLPVSAGGETVPHNLVTACNDCNAGKSGRLPILKEGASRG